MHPIAGARLPATGRGRVLASSTNEYAASVIQIGRVCISAFFFRFKRSLPCRIFIAQTTMGKEIGLLSLTVASVYYVFEMLKGLQVLTEIEKACGWVGGGCLLLALRNFAANTRRMTFQKVDPDLILGVRNWRGPMRISYFVSF